MKIKVFYARRIDLHSFFTNFDLPMIHFPSAYQDITTPPKTIKTNIID